MAMPGRPRPRFYLTTAIAYANSQPGVHTLYEVIGADAIARWHRMRGDDTRFLTGTDEHSVNIAMRSAEEGRDPRAFVDEKVALFKAAEDLCPNRPDVPLQWLTEQNWFFRLSAYQERLERHFLDHPGFVQPDYRRNEMLG